MDLFGIGVPEFFVILILALIVIGPRDLPKVAARLGKYVRDLRVMSEGFRAEWRRELGDAGLEDIAELRAELMSARQALQEAGQEIREVGQSVQSEVKDASDSMEAEVKDAHSEMSTATKEVNAELRETVSTVKTVGAAPKVEPEAKQSESEKASETGQDNDNTKNSVTPITAEADSDNDETETTTSKPMIIPGKPDIPVVESQTGSTTNGVSSVAQKSTSDATEATTDDDDDFDSRTIHPPQSDPEPVAELAQSPDSTSSDD